MAASMRFPCYTPLDGTFSIPPTLGPYDNKQWIPTSPLFLPLHSLFTISIAALLVPFLYHLTLHPLRPCIVLSTCIFDFYLAWLL